MRRLIDWNMVDELASEFVEDRSPERVFRGKETLSSVMRSLGELEERTRNIFILFRLENMKQREIAALYGISQSTVEKHVMKAVMHLTLRCGGDMTRDTSRSQDEQ
jgi:RNA polymerase sigma-70 factor (ECF subfamily)